MKWIETLGAPGVGKTYFLQKLGEVANKHKIERQWITENQFTSTVIKEIKLEEFDRFYERFLLLYARQSFLNYKKEGVHSVLLNAIFHRRSVTKISSWNRYRYLHSIGVKNLSLQPALREHLVQFYNHILKKAQFYHFFNLNLPIFFNEGPIHNNLGLNREVDETGEELMLPILVFYYKEDVEVILKRIRKRQKETGEIRPEHQGLEDKELKQVIENIIFLIEEKVIWLKLKGVKLVEINSQIVNNDAEVFILLKKMLNK